MKDGVYELNEAGLLPVTQAISESNDKITMRCFDEVREIGIIPIDEACAKCDHCHFNTAKECQERQAEDARARGFTQVICPEQFKDDL